MKAEYSNAVNEALEDALAAVRKAFFKQVGLLVQNLHHPSLHAKKYDESNDQWQARVIAVQINGLTAGGSGGSRLPVRG